MNKVSLVILLLGFLLVLYQISFPKEVFIETWVHNALRQIPRILMVLYVTKWVFHEVFKENKTLISKRYNIELFLFLLLFAFNAWKKNSEILSSEYFLYLLITTLFFLQIMEISAQFKNSLLNPPILFALSFLILIFWGTAMLLIPHATHGKFKFIDAAFMATSSVCVTGLASVDVSTKFTDLGSQILLFLFQFGGLGLMTFTNFFAVLFKGGTSLRNQLMLSNIVELEEANSLFSVLKRIVFYTIFMEVAGTILIYFVTTNSLDLSTGKHWFFALFHSVASFCGAGFSTLTDGLQNSTLKYNYPFLLIVASLVIFGGLGYPVVTDLWNAIKRTFRGGMRYLLFKERYEYPARILSVHSKLVLTTSGLLLLIGTGVFFLLEYQHSLTEHSTQGGKLVLSFFSATVPRSAGFNAVNMSNLAQGTILMYILLMWIGGAPNSTAGGIKVTTFSLAFLSVFSLAKGRERIEVFRREITLRSIQRSYVVIFLSFIIIGLGVFLVSLFDPGVPLQMVAFECFSAYGTVGLSLNLTPQLSTESKWVIMILMYLGRVGLFTLLFGLFSRNHNEAYQYPHESVQVL